MAGRTSQAGRRRAARRARAEVGRARREAERRLSSGGARSTAVTGFGYVGAAIIGIWMGLAHALGWLARAAGRQAAAARELDREHRRDGAGLAVFAVALVLAVAVWFSGAGPFGVWLAGTTRLLVGAVATALPLLLLIGAVRLMRAPAEPGHRGRGVVGWSALIVAAAGLLHLGRHAPVEVELTDRAGGLLGRGVGSGLAAGVTQYVAVILLILLGLFGLLVITATPINKIPARLVGVWNYLVGAPASAPVAEGEVVGVDIPEPPALRRGPARRRQAIYAANHSAVDDAEVRSEALM
ncbi:MAG: DNA translocase FtsK 4TM domain-containing protein, partial [Micromonosporaceae bacterium]